MPLCKQITIWGKKNKEQQQKHQKTIKTTYTYTTMKLCLTVGDEFLSITKEERTISFELIFNLIRFKEISYCTLIGFI